MHQDCLLILHLECKVFFICVLTCCSERLKADHATELENLQEKQKQVKKEFFLAFYALPVPYVLCSVSCTAIQFSNLSSLHLVQFSLIVDEIY